MKYIDLHCDTLMRTWALRQGDPWENTGEVDLRRLLRTGYAMQCFACFTDRKRRSFGASHYEDALSMAALLQKSVREHADVVAFARDYSEYRKNQAEGKLSVMLTVEDGGILDGQAKRLDTLYEAGVRMLTLTWNYPNCIGFPNQDFTYRERGLTPFGRELLERMDDLGIAADVSHLSDGGFFDVARYGRRPFIATHSNARSVAGHPRNLTDDMLKTLADAGGVAGLNFYGPFVGGDGRDALEGLRRQARHMLDVGGREILCIGSDFDGMPEKAALAGCEEMPGLAAYFSQNGFTDAELEAVFYRNAEGFMERFWGK